MTFLLVLSLLGGLTVPPDPPAAELPPVPPPETFHADSVAARYAQQDQVGLEALRRAARSVADDLLVRYRLYPLSKDPRALDGLPDEATCHSARELALLAALWAYRAADAPAWRLPAYGRRSDGLLRRARALDPDDPFVLLVDGQSLLFRPALFGGDTEAALDRFVALRDELRRRERAGHAEAGLPLIEAEVWVWYTLRRLGRPGTERVRDRLLAQAPPPLYRQFLTAPL